MVSGVGLINEVNRHRARLVLGAIDCTHVAIKAPSSHEKAFVNHKGIHTVNIQAVCDNDMRITNLVAKWPVRPKCRVADVGVIGNVPRGGTELDNR